jgi:rhamnosyltransferase
MKNKIALMIVTFNPTVMQIKKFNKMLSYVDKLLVIDNSCSIKIERLFKKIKNKKIKVIFNNGNFGIGKPTNYFFDYLKNYPEYNWALLMDQDSLLEFDIHFILKNLCKNRIKVAGLSYSENKITQNIKLKPLFKKTKRHIHSGLIIHKSIFYKFKYDEKLFLDMSDFDFCANLQKNNVDIYNIENFFIQHFVGNPKLNNFLFLRKSRTNHPPINCFFMSRNRVIMIKKGLYLRGYFDLILNQIKEILLTIIFEKNIYPKIKARILGFYCGINNIIFNDINEIKKYINTN